MKNALNLFIFIFQVFFTLLQIFICLFFKVFPGISVHLVWRHSQESSKLCEMLLLKTTLNFFSFINFPLPQQSSFSFYLWLKCVCERERERKRVFVNVCVNVCVCEWERESLCMWVCVCVHACVLCVNETEIYFKEHLSEIFHLSASLTFFTVVLVCGSRWQCSFPREPIVDRIREDPFCQIISWKRFQFQIYDETFDTKVSRNW